MFSKVDKWTGNNLIKITAVWLIILIFIFIVAYPIYFILAFGLAIAGIPLWIKDKEIRHQAIGFYLAFFISLYVCFKLIDAINWWG
jgi:hypothetical protein